MPSVPASANYRLGSPGCGTCAAFTEGLCSTFDAPVDAAYTCDEYTERMKAAKNFVGVEIARTGKFDASTGPVTFTVKDFEEAEKAYKALHEKLRSPIKLGHDDKQKLLQEDGYPNAGILRNIRSEGDRLVADFMDVPDPVALLIESGRLNARSIEALRNTQVDGKKWPFVITGLALLGADLPAVDSLKDVVQLYASRRIEMPTATTGEVVIAAAPASEAVDTEEIVKELQSLLAKAEAVIYKRGGAPKLRTLVRAAVDELRAIAHKRVKAAKEDIMDLAKLTKLLGLEDSATEEDVEKELTKLRKALADHSANATKLSDLEKKLVEAQANIVALQGVGAKAEATKKVDDAIVKARKFAPASRDTLIEMAVSSPTQFDALVAATPANAILAKTGEVGHDGEGDGPTDLEPTKAQESILAQSGITREEFIEQRAKELGKPVPEPVAKVLATRRGQK